MYALFLINSHHCRTKLLQDINSSINSMVTCAEIFQDFSFPHHKFKWYQTPGSIFTILQTLFQMYLVLALFKEYCFPILTCMTVCLFSNMVIHVCYLQIKYCSLIFSHNEWHAIAIHVSLHWDWCDTIAVRVYLGLHLLYRTTAWRLQPSAGARDPWGTGLHQGLFLYPHAAFHVICS